jgi:hypothetical protein
MIPAPVVNTLDTIGAGLTIGEENVAAEVQFRGGGAGKYSQR